MKKESPTPRAAHQRLLPLFLSQRGSLLGAVCLPLGVLLLMPACKPSCETLRTCPKPEGLAGDSGTGGLAGDSGAGGKDQDGQKGSGGTSSGGMSGGGTSGSAGSEPTECVPGEFLASADDPLVCEPCSSGTFSTKKNAKSCSVWKSCAVGNQVAVDGTAKSDRECEPCPAETFSSQKNQAACAGWTACAPGYVEAEAGSSTADRACSLVEWTRQFKENSYPLYGPSVTQDREGNIIVAGRGALEGEASAGGNDAYVQARSPNGEVLWSHQFGTGEGDSASGVTVAPNGNIVVAGSTSGALQGSNSGGGDAFARVISPDGELLWTRQFGTSGNEGGDSVAVDGSGNVIVAGNTDGALEGKNAGGSDAYVRVFAPNGDLLWTRQFGSDVDETGVAVAVDGGGNIAVVGSTGGALQGENAGGDDAFVRVFSPSGDVLWTRQFGTSSGDGASAVAVDENGNLAVVGSTSGALQGASAGDYDAFVRVFSSAGTVLWTRQFGTDKSDSGSSVAVDASGNIIVAGSTSGVLGGTNAGSNDGFLQLLSASGELVWTRQFGTEGSERATSVAVDGSGGFLLAGWTNGAFPGQSPAAFEGFDGFVARLGPPMN